MAMGSMTRVLPLGTVTGTMDTLVVHVAAAGSHVDAVVGTTTCTMIRTKRTQVAPVVIGRGGTETAVVATAKPHPAPRSLFCLTPSPQRGGGTCPCPSGRGRPWPTMRAVAEAGRNPWGDLPRLAVVPSPP